MTTALQQRSGISRIGVLATSVAVALQILLVATSVANPLAQAQTLIVLHYFTFGTDGANSHAGLIRDAAGNLYGTTANGGASNFGTVFKLDATGKESVLYSFTGGADGATPVAGLIGDAAGNLYSTTYRGGDLGCGHGYGCGTIFKLDATGKQTVLHSFTGGDGAYPVAGLIGDAAGNLYSTTYMGGASDFGTVFKLTLNTTGKYEVLYSFTGGGQNPEAGLIRDAAGNLYGTTSYGGDSNFGTVFKLDATGKEIVLHSFTGAVTGADGAFPIAGLIRDAAGNLYGTTFYGGDIGCGHGYGCGTIFKLDATGKEIVLHSFTGADGANPEGGLIRDAAGNLYGTTSGGGPSLVGTVFKLTP